MPFDALTLSAIRAELLEKVAGGRIQDVVMPGPLTLGLQIYRAGVGRLNLLISAHPQNARIHLVKSAPSRDPAQKHPLLLLLRKYVRGGMLVGIAQPRLERVLTLSIAKRISPHKHQEYHSGWDFRHTGAPDDALDEEPEDELAPLVTVELVAELMGKVSNIVLVGEDGTVMESIKRIPASINRYRVTLPNHPYVSPPPQEKRDALRTTINALALEIERAAASDAGAPAWKGLVGGYAAVSPTLAREAMFRALGAAQAEAAEVSRQPQMLEAVLRELQGLLRLEEAQAWEHTLAVRADEERKPFDFAPYPLLHLEAQGGELVRCETISEAAERYFEGGEGKGRHSALRAAIAERLADMTGRDERKLSSLQEEWRRAQALEELRRKGELLLAYMHTLEPGQTKLVIPDEKLTIELDPALTPVENSQAIFREYRKAQSAVEGLPERMSEAEVRLAYLDELATSLDLADTYDDIKSVQSEIEAAGRPMPQAQVDGTQKRKKGARGQVKLPQPLRLQTSNGLGLLLGRTAGQNDTATFRLAAPEDLWFHARNAPGSHVILRADARLDQEDILEAARLAAGYSKLRGDAQVDVVYTERKFVRKIPNAPPGQVTYKHERTIRVEPRRTTDSRGP
jgi:predicted ribosome quality control (RQC) complex YloA/Tae2 family protein